MTVRPVQSGTVLLVLFICGSIDGIAAPPAGNCQAKALELAGEYLVAKEDDRRHELAQQLAEYDSFADAVIGRLRQQRYEHVNPGYHPEERFSDPSLLDKHPEDLLYFHIPRNYRPDKPCGLVVFMHGGGGDTEREAPHYSIRPEDADDDDECVALGSLMDDADLIIVGPSAPWDEDCYQRWCLPEADDYLADVILECKHRFNIDVDRVFLLGHSMGGFGAFHHVQRQPDRFAAVIAHAGSWDLGYWPVIRGTKLCFINGVKDAEKEPDGDSWVRWHYTDIIYGRETHRLLTEHKLDHVFYEHPDGHDLSYGKPYIAKFLVASKDVRRDPYYPHIAIATPIGYSDYYASPVRHNRWLTMNDLKPGTIVFDELVSNDDDDLAFDDWKLQHETTEHEGSSLGAVNRGDNTIEVTTQHVSRFTIWLHPKMVDVNRPVRVIVDGEVKFEAHVPPSLVTALDSYLRRNDWGLVYPMKVELELKDE